ncbi:MAG: caspase family protein, partial [Rhodospirillales bacterium]
AALWPVAPYRDRFSRPAAINNEPAALDVKDAVRCADAEAGRKARDEIGLRALLPPVIAILSPEPGSAVPAGRVALRYAVRSPSGEKVTAVRALIDGRPATQERNLSLAAPADVERTATVAVPAGAVEIALIAETANAVGEPARLRLIGKPAAAAPAPGPAAASAKPKLNLLSIGVSQYRRADLNLGLAAKDAADLARLVEGQRGALYDAVQVKLLSDEAATREAVIDGMDWILRETGPRDLAMVFVAAHGVNDDAGVYYLLPHDADPDRLRSTAVPQEELRRTLAAVAGKALFFIDTCHAGNVLGKLPLRRDVNRLVNELASAESGVVVFAASTGQQLSAEDPSWGNGAFTKALLEGLAGKADYSRRGVVTINALDLYIAERVAELTRGRQTPTTAKPQTIANFPVAAVR